MYSVEGQIQIQSLPKSNQKSNLKLIYKFSEKAKDSAFMDYTTGLHKYHTNWNWLIAKGSSKEGEEIGLSLGSDLHRDKENKMNNPGNVAAFWIGPKLYRVPRVYFQYENLKSDWNISSFPSSLHMKNRFIDAINDYNANMNGDYIYHSKIKNKHNHFNGNNNINNNDHDHELNNDQNIVNNTVNNNNNNNLIEDVNNNTNDNNNNINNVNNTKVKGEIELKFIPEGAFKDHENIGKIIETNFVQSHGHIYGHIKTNDNKDFHIDNMIGVTEQHFANW